MISRSAPACRQAGLPIPPLGRIIWVT